jgi:uncharacterized membrane protein
VEEGLRASESAGGRWVARGPYVLLILAAAFLATRWTAIPPRFPVQWHLDGTPSRFVERSALGVLAPIAVALAVCGLLRAVSWAVPLVSRVPPGGHRAALVPLLASEYLVALVFSIVALATALTWPHAGAWITATVVVGIGGLVATLIVANRWVVAAGAAHGPDGVPDHHAWRWGLFYVNAEDPALLVPKRMGVGYTLNFGRPGAWLLLGGLGVLIVGLVGLVTFITKG